MKLPTLLLCLFFTIPALRAQVWKQTNDHANDTSCETRLTIAQSLFQSGDDQEAYQAYKLYVENCYNDPESWRAFNRLSSSNITRKPDTVGKNYEFREWLKKVLYYNTNDLLYYCEDLMAMAKSYAAWDRADETQANAIITLFRYLIDSTDCGNDEYLKEGILEVRKFQYEIWIDTVKDSLETPLDTTLPTIDELGLALIRKSQVAVLPTTARPLSPLIDMSAVPNPFSSEISIEYVLADNAIVNIEILDILGKEVYRTTRQLQTVGKHLEKIITTNWQEGTYFARLSTSTGETTTIKLILKR